jgi:hypothetical protein
MEKSRSATTVPRRTLGRYLHDLRERAGMSVLNAARALECSTQKIWRIETAQNAVKRLDVKNMCELYGADAELTAALMALAGETKATGWWHAYGDVIPESFDLFFGLEEAASELRSYQTEVVPGLCQSEEYARCLIRKGYPNGDDAEIERRVNLRTSRGRILHRPAGAPDTRFVLGEGILRRPVGGSRIMAAQLDHLIEVADLPTTRLRVLPFAAGLHHGVISGPFVAMRFPARGVITEPPTVYVESLMGALYLEREQEIERYDAVFQEVWDASADEAESVKMIKRAAMELKRS